jgi:tetratricopeptide (TPR) repeat protein
VSPSDPAASSSLRRWAPLLVAGAAVLPYLGVLHAPFVFDDHKLVVENPLLRVEGREGLERVLSTLDITSRRWDEAEVRENYRPLRFLSYLIDYRLTRLLFPASDPAAPPPFFFHLQNVLWHALNALLVLAIGRRLLGSLEGGLVLALLFALHPLQTEAVTYVSSRRDVLSTFFFLAALALYLRSPAGERLRWVPLMATPLLYGAGLLAKEMAVTLPAVVLLIELLRRPRWEPRRLACHGVLWGVAAWFAWATLSNPGLVDEGAVKAAGGSLLDASRYLTRYLGLILLPVSQSIDYSYDAIPLAKSLGEPRALFEAALTAALAAAGLWALFRRRLVAALGLLWFIGVSAPILQIVPIPERFAERFAYLPSLGVLLLAAALLSRLIRLDALLGWGAAGTLAALLLYATVMRNADWRSPLELWASAARAQPRCARAHLSHGNALKESSPPYLEEAADAYTRALEIWAESPAPAALQHGQALQARMFRGGVYALLGAERPELLERAEEDLRLVLASQDTGGVLIESSPIYTNLHHELAGVLVRLGRLDDAERLYRRIIEIGGAADRVGRAYYYLGKLRLGREDVRGGVDLLEKAVAALPRDDRYIVEVRLELADILRDLAPDLERAWRALEETLPLARNRAERAGILLRQARILDRQGESHAARQKVEEALAADPDSVAATVTLADMEAKQGLFEKAEARLRRALAKAPASPELLEALRGINVHRKLEAARQPRRGADADLSGYIIKAREHWEAGQLLAARDVYGQLLQRAAEAGDRELVAQAYGGVARVEDRLGRHESARDALLKSLKAVPERAETLLALADLHRLRFDDPAGARDYYERSLAALRPGEPASPRVHEGLGSLLRSSDPFAALEHYLQARELSARRGQQAMTASLDLEIGRLCAELGRWKESLEAFQRFLESREAGISEAEKHEARRFVDEKVIPHLLEER